MDNLLYLNNSFSYVIRLIKHLRQVYRTYVFSALHGIIINININKNGRKLALARWLGWLEHHPIHQKVEGLIPSQGTYLGCRFDPLLGHIFPLM